MKAHDLRNGTADAVTLAGYFAAHAVWGISQGSPLFPMLAYLRQDGVQKLRDLSSVEAHGAVEQGRQWLNANPARARCAVLLYDTYVTWPGFDRTDAVMIEVRAYEAHPPALTILVPYRNPADERRLAVYRLKFMAGSDPAALDLQHLCAAFFAGVDQHEQGAGVWIAHLDESR